MVVKRGETPGDKALLQDRRVLIVEDQYLIADEMRRAVSALGGTVVGPCATLQDALNTVEYSTPDLAILDINLRGEEVFELAEELSRREIPFIFATGYEGWSIPERFRDRPRLEKPVRPSALREAVERLCGERSNGHPQVGDG